LRWHIAIDILLQKCFISELFWSKAMDISIKDVPEEQVRRLRERAKANHRSLQGELRALIDEATGMPRPLTVEEIVARVSKLGLVRRDEAARLVREDRDR
jgi:antitoxin FitA